MDWMDGSIPQSRQNHDLHATTHQIHMPRHLGKTPNTTNTNNNHNINNNKHHRTAWRPCGRGATRSWRPSAACGRSKRALNLLCVLVLVVCLFVCFFNMSVFMFFFGHGRT